jgi:signal transduction histidine kinase
MLKNFNETERLHEVNSYRIEDTITEKEYDDIAFLASAICGTPIALVTLMYHDRQWFKAAVGTDMKENKRDLSFCTHAMAGDDDVMVVENATADERFRHNPLVDGEPHLKFYAGASIINKNGFCLGTVCVYDLVEKSLTEVQIQSLRILSERVMGLLELRKQNFQLEMMKERLMSSNKSLEAFAMVLAHDIKSPLSSVIMVNDLLNEQLGESDAGAKELIEMSRKSTNKIIRLVDGILSYSKVETSYNKTEIIELNSFFEQIKSTLLSPKPLIFSCNLTVDTISFNRVQLEQVFQNLFTNAIRYNDKEHIELKVSAKQEEGYYYFEVTDNGMGIAKENHLSVFNLFGTVAEKDTYGLGSSGIGLNIVKKIIKTANGNIEVTSTPGISTTFLFHIKSPDVQVVPIQEIMVPQYA